MLHGSRCCFHGGRCPFFVVVFVAFLVLAMVLILIPFVFELDPLRLITFLLFGFGFDIFFLQGSYFLPLLI